MAVGLWSLLLISCSNTEYPQILQNYLESGVGSGIPNFSYAGYEYGEEFSLNATNLIVNVKDFGASGSDSDDDTKAINNAIDFVGRGGGGIVFLPKGKYYVNSDIRQTEIITINHSNIVLKGEGVGPGGTIIYSRNSTLQLNNPWLSPFIVHTGLNLHNTSSFHSISDEKVLGYLTKDGLAGRRIIELTSTSDIKPGDVIFIGMRNTDDSGNLMKDLMSPLTFEPFQTSYLNAGVRRDPSYQWMVEVEKVIDEHRILLCQPLNRDIGLKYEAFVTKTSLLTNIGIESVRFESEWNGEYVHHGNAEMDYGWGAICMHRVIHGWINNVTINNYTQTVHLVNSKNVTVSNVRITGGEGHYGPKMYSSSDNLVQNIQIDAKRTHGVGLEGCSFGNVFRNVEHKYTAPIDLHGISDVGFCPPMYNLFENIRGVSAIAGGGAPQNLPHAGEGNVFWNIEMTGWKDNGKNEVFYSWVWRDSVRFNNKMHIDCHKQYPKSKVVGLYHPNSSEMLSIEHKLNDRWDDWIYVEGLNKRIEVSLFEWQRSMLVN